MTDRPVIEWQIGDKGSLIMTPETTFTVMGVNGNFLWAQIETKINGQNGPTFFATYSKDQCQLADEVIISRAIRAVEYTVMSYHGYYNKENLTQAHVNDILLNLHRAGFEIVKRK